MTARIDKARKLRSRIFDYALDRFREEYLTAHKERFGELQAPSKQIPEKAWQDFMESFIFDRGPEKESIVESFRENIKIEDKETARLVDLWEGVQHGMYRTEEDEGGSLMAFSLISEARFRLDPGMATQFPPGSYFVCRLFPLGDKSFVPGVVSSLPMQDPSIKANFLKTALTFQAMSPPRALASNPEKARRSKEVSERRFKFFLDTFGSNVVSAPKDELLTTLAKFRDSFRASETEPVLCPDMDADMPAKDLPEGELTVMIHPMTGIDMLNGYSEFVECCKEGEVKAEHQETFVSYSANMVRIPSVWKSVLRDHPENTLKALKQVVDPDKIDLFMAYAEQAFIGRSMFAPCVAVLDDELITAMPEFLATLNKKKA